MAMVEQLIQPIKDIVPEVFNAVKGFIDAVKEKLKVTGTIKTQISQVMER